MHARRCAQWPMPFASLRVRHPRSCRVRMYARGRSGGCRPHSHQKWDGAVKSPRHSVVITLLHITTCEVAVFPFPARHLILPHYNRTQRTAALGDASKDETFNYIIHKHAHGKGRQHDTSPNGARGECAPASTARPLDPRPNAGLAYVSEDVPPSRGTAYTTSQLLGAAPAPASRCVVDSVLRHTAPHHHAAGCKRQLKRHSIAVERRRHRAGKLRDMQPAVPG